MVNRELHIPVNTLRVLGNLVIPDGAVALILFAHGSGSSRLSPRNKMVAEYLQAKGFGTLLFDLLTEQEDSHYFNRFNIALLADRLRSATNRLQELPEIHGMPMGYFGASTGAAAALAASVDCPQVKAIVSRGGRPDLAGDILHRVQAPVMLIVGERDEEVMALNKKAFLQLTCKKELKRVTGATHLFQEAGKMEEVCLLAANWFTRQLLPSPA